MDATNTNSEIDLSQWGLDLSTPKLLKCPDDGEFWQNPENHRTVQRHNDAVHLARDYAWRSLWNPAPIPPLVKLAELTDVVLGLSEKHSPHWKFRLAHDLAVEMHAKPSRKFRYGFDNCRVISAAPRTPKDLANLKNIDHHCWMLSFQLTVAENASDWTFKARGTHHEGPKREREEGFRYADPQPYIDLRERIIGQLAQLNDIKPNMMLGKNCV
jgi:hypothetical protein